MDGTGSTRLRTPRAVDLRFPRLHEGTHRGGRTRRNSATERAPSKATAQSERGWSEGHRRRLLASSATSADPQPSGNGLGCEEEVTERIVKTLNIAGRRAIHRAGAAFLALVFAASLSVADEKRSTEHYLMLVNTALAEKMKPEMLRQFDKSPYDGLAVAFSWNYDTKPAPTVADIDAQIASWRNLTKKDIWPWVYLNRIVATDDAQKNPYTTGPYF